MMKIFRLFGLLGICLLALSSCSKEEPLRGEGLEHKKTSGKVDGLYSVTVNGIVSDVRTRGVDDVLDVPNGQVKGAGLYDGDDGFILRVLPNAGCRIKTFEGGKIGEPVENHLTTKNREGATLQKEVENSDWKFNVEIVKTFRIRVASGTSQSVELLIDGERVAEKVYGEGDPCTLSVRYPTNGNEVFDGWYDGMTKLSSDVSYTFTVSASKTIETKFKKKEKKQKVVNIRYSLSQKIVRQTGTSEEVKILRYITIRSSVAGDTSGLGRVRLRMNGLSPYVDFHYPVNVYDGIEAEYSRSGENFRDGFMETHGTYPESMDVFIDGEHVRTIECDPYPSFLEVSLDGMTFEDERYKVTFKKQDGL